MTHHVSEFVGLAVAQSGDRYVFAADPSPDNANPRSFDCSGLVHWATGRLGIPLAAPSQNQLNHMIPLGSVQRGIDTYGALLGHDGWGADGHIAISLGNGTTIEAKGRSYGVGEFSAYGRGFTRAGLVPGLDYTNPTAADLMALARHWAAVAAYWQAVQEEQMSERGLAVDVIMNPNGSGQGYQLDRWGGVHALNGAKPVQTGSYWRAWDIARKIVITDWAKPAGYVMDGFGGMHPFGGAPNATGAGYWPGT